MRPTFPVLAVLACVLAWPVGAAETDGASGEEAGVLAPLDTAEAKVVEVWEATPLTFRTALFVNGSPQGFGMYDPRPGSSFASGEAMTVYAEPVGYKWREEAGEYRFGFACDFAIKTVTGASLGEQKGFATLEKLSRVRNREFFLKFDYQVKGLVQGHYILTTTVHDIVDGRTASFDLPFTID
jgi:hypothetical protein